MKKLNPYLVFSGNCKEALQFYAECLNGEITLLQTFREAPMPVPDDCKDRIFNAIFKADDLIFMASDDLPDYSVSQGTNISMFLSFSDTHEQESVFNQLADGGKVLFPLANGFGMVTDKFGVQWMIASEGK